MKRILSVIALIASTFVVAQEVEALWECSITSLSGIESDTIVGEVYYVLPVDSSAGYDAWCGTYLPTANWISYYDSTNSSVESMFFTIKGMGLHGKCSRWYAGGQIKRTAFYTEGVVTQYDSNWYENGNLYFVKTWGDDGMVSSTWWFSNGKLKDEVYWKDGQPYGVWRSYDKTGAMIREDDKGAD